MDLLLMSDSSSIMFCTCTLSIPHVHSSFYVSTSSVLLLGLKYKKEVLEGTECGYFTGLLLVFEGHYLWNWQLINNQLERNLFLQCCSVCFDPRYTKSTQKKSIVTEMSLLCHQAHWCKQIHPCMITLGEISVVWLPPYRMISIYYRWSRKAMN